MTTSNLPEKPDRCGECTACCLLLEVPQLEKKANQNCLHCIAKKGCAIWTTRPQVCRNFGCAYYQNDSANIALRPDKCKMIFEKVTDRIFFGTQDPDHEITKVAKDQITNFNQQGFTVFVSIWGTKAKVHLAPKHDQAEIHQEFQNYLTKRDKESPYGSPKLYN